MATSQRVLGVASVPQGSACLASGTWQGRAIALLRRVQDVRRTRAMVRKPLKRPHHGHPLQAMEHE